MRNLRPPVAARNLLTGTIMVAAVSVATATGPRFFADDPIAREPECCDASGAVEADVSLLYDLSYNLFATSRREPSNTRAQNINTIGEVPDSGWFTNRILPRRGSAAELTRGPNTGPAPNPERWVLVREKSSGYAPGFTARDGNGETWFLSFDPPDAPEGATAAMTVASKIFWALGYNQIETFITSVDPRKLTIDPTATMRRPNGKRTPFTKSDLEAVFERAARNTDGTYRAAAGRLLPGKVLGPFRYEGTRSDDPNDIVPHEHRRELRALRVFGAWTNLTDLKAGNTLDTLVTVNGRAVIRHYLQDVGSTFGVGANGPHDWDEGFEYFYEGPASRRRLASLGFARSPWQRAQYESHPSVGRFESEEFDPLTWRPHVPTAAYIEMLPDDAFWAARRVAAFDDELIQAIVHTGEFSDAAAERHLATILIQRRDKVARAYLTSVNPVVDPRLDANGTLTFANAAVDAHAAGAPDGYRTSWAEFDNATGATRPLGEVETSTASAKAPRALPANAGAVVQIEVTDVAAAGAAAHGPVRAYFRRANDAWTLVGLER
jgi:hypothetical protein